MAIDVELVDTRHPDIAICKVTWNAPSGERLKAFVQVKTDLSALPTWQPVAGVVDDMRERAELPEVVGKEAILKAKGLAHEFDGTDF